ncbi:hypothetical protein BD626DRAFT_586564 [Schizophyllum amplum]|uniref:F-box domain-containing protein n=1 Tax=Schizophyllum amplum TaxID=97359 RepID=A0A550BYD1_9AGAR|nr:hypothetical protein BD626DRAFT_586564 [Auriculariopsis ampla]
MANIVSRPSRSSPVTAAEPDHPCYTPQPSSRKLPLVRTRICQHCDHTLVCENRDLKKAIQPVYAALREGVSRMHVNADAVVKQIAVYDSDIGLYDDEITELERVMRVLKSKRGELQRVADANRSLISPIRRLPVEILTTIFRYTLDGPDMRLPLTPNSSPTWLRAAKPPRNIDRRRRALHEQLAITAPKPISLAIEDFSSILMHGGDREDYGLPVQQPMIEDPLFTNSHRWRSLKMSLGPRSFRHLLEFEGSVSQLTTLSLSADRPFPGEDFGAVSELRLFADAPRLKKVMLCPPFYPARVLLPYAQLTHLTVIGMEWSHIAYLFQHCSSLVLARIYAGRGPLPTDGIAETSPVLRSSFSVLEAPRLTKLVLHSLPDCDALEDMIQRSGCKITTLCLSLRFLRGTTVNAEVVRRLLDLMPHLRTFEVTLDVLEGAATFIQLLFAEMSVMINEDKTEPRVLPLLRRFSFTLIGRRPVCDEELVRVVEARMRCVEFRCLNVKCPLPEQRIEQLRECSERGLEVYGLKDCDLKFVAFNRGMASSARLATYFARAMSGLMGKAGKMLFERHMESYSPADPMYEEYVDAKGRTKRRRRKIPPGLSKRDAKILKSVQRRAHYLDKGFSMCGMRFGWTFIIGIIPMAGDIVDATLNYTLVVRKARKAELPAWLANSRNAALLEEFLRIRGEELLKLQQQGVNPAQASKPTGKLGGKGKGMVAHGVTKADAEQVKPGAGASSRPAPQTMLSTETTTSGKSKKSFKSWFGGGGSQKDKSRGKQLAPVPPVPGDRGRFVENLNDGGGR